MPDDPVPTAPPPPVDAATAVIGETAAQTQRVESTSVLWLLMASGLLLVLASWLLPWFVEGTASGIGHSPQDVVVSAPTGVGYVLVVLMGVCMLALLAGLGFDVFAAQSKRRQPFLWARWRGIVALAGAASVLGIWALVGLAREEPLFGDISADAHTDNAVWMALVGFCVLGFAYLARDWISAHGGYAFAGVAFVVGGLFPLIFNQSADFIVWGAQSAGIYILLALGLNVVVGFAGLLDLGYAAFFAIGAYTAASAASPRHGLHLPFWVILFLAVAVAALFGAILGAPTLRLRGDYLAIVTLGFGEIVPDMAKNNFLNQTGGPNGVSGVDNPVIFAKGHVVYDYGLFGANPRPYFWTILILIAAVVVLLRNVEHSRLGRAWVAIREDEIAAAAMGINTVSTKLLAFSIGASVSGFAGAFFGAMSGTVTPDNFEFAVSVTALTTVVLGGIGNITGVTVGAILVSFVIFWVLPSLQEWMGTLGGTVGVSGLGSVHYSDYKFAIYGLILISIMLLRPAGLLPSRARKVELQTGTESTPLAAVQGKA